MKLGGFFGKILFTKRCISCEKEGSYFCKTCIDKVPRSIPLGSDTYPLFEYRDIYMTKALWQMKYLSRDSIAETFSEYILEEIENIILEKALFEKIGQVTIVPIPMSEKRKKKRGKNHIKTLADFVSEKSSYPVSDILIKHKETDPQARIKNRSKRLRNVSGSMSYKKDSEKDIVGKTVILIDDIITTGATINEAKRVLKKLKPKSVITITIAH
ncbi:MAG: ComF family protein [Candidatus Nomurabacteria bacterium]|nr:MAG: ComF family protein [Candidatus Nomurabacteria bacterium]